MAAAAAAGVDWRIGRRQKLLRSDRKRDAAAGDRDIAGVRNLVRRFIVADIARESPRARLIVFTGGGRTTRWTGAAVACFA